MDPPVGEPAEHALGRSRGGRSTKVHLVVGQRRTTLAIELTPGQPADSPQFTTVLERIRVPRRTGPGRPGTRPDRVLADRAYSGRPTGPIWAKAASRQPFRSSATSSIIAGRRGPPAVARRHSTRSSTGSGTPSSAAATGTSSTAASSPATASSPSATRDRPDHQHSLLAARLSNWAWPSPRGRRRRLVVRARRQLPHGACGRGRTPASRRSRARRPRPMRWPDRSR